MRNIQSQNTNFEINVNTLAAAASEKQSFDGLEDDQQIQSNRDVLEVVQVVGDLLDIVFERGAISVIDLRPASGARFNHPALFVEGNLASTFLFLVRHKRPRSHKIHVAAENVVELRQPIEASWADPLP